MWTGFDIMKTRIADENLSIQAIAKFERVRDATLAKKAVVLQKTLANLMTADSNPSGVANTVEQITPIPLIAFTNALAGIPDFLYVPVTDNGTFFLYGPMLLTELQEIISSLQEGDHSNLENPAQIVANFVGDVSKMENGTDQDDCLFVGATLATQQSIASVQGSGATRPNL